MIPEFGSLKKTLSAVSNLRLKLPRSSHTDRSSNVNQSEEDFISTEFISSDGPLRCVARAETNSVTAQSSQLVPTSSMTPVTSPSIPSTARYSPLTGSRTVQVHSYFSEKECRSPRRRRPRGKSIGLCSMIAIGKLFKRSTSSHRLQETLSKSINSRSEMLKMTPSRFSAYSKRTSSYLTPTKSDVRRVRVVSLCALKGQSEDSAASLNKATCSTIRLLHILVSVVTSAYLFINANRITVAEEIRSRLGKTTIGNRVLHILVYVINAAQVIFNLSRLAFMVFRYVVDHPDTLVRDALCILSGLRRAWISFGELEARKTAELMDRCGFIEESIPERVQPVKVADFIREYKSVRRSRRRLMAGLEKTLVDEF